MQEFGSLQAARSGLKTALESPTRSLGVAKWPREGPGKLHVSAVEHQVSKGRPLAVPILESWIAPSG